MYAQKFKLPRQSMRVRNRMETAVRHISVIISTIWSVPGSSCLLWWWGCIRSVDHPMRSQELKTGAHWDDLGSAHDIAPDGAMRLCKSVSARFDESELRCFQGKVEQRRRRSHLLNDGGMKLRVVLRAMTPFMRVPMDDEQLVEFASYSSNSLFIKEQSF